MNVVRIQNSQSNRFGIFYQLAPTVTHRGITLYKKMCW
jgi:hypothetical protein